VLDGATEGNLCIADSWPGQMRTVYGDHERFFQTYFSPTRASISPATAAAAMPTAITGSPAASTTSSTSPATAWAPPKSNRAGQLHPKVSEAAVVGYPHDIKGQGIYAYVTLMPARAERRAAQGAVASMGPQGDRPDRTPDLIQFAPGLPKTRSGKIMRRILRKIAEDDFGDIAGRYLDAGRSAVVDDLIANRRFAQTAKPAREIRQRSASTSPRRKPSVKPGDDFWMYANGGWNERVEIAADRASAGFGTQL
jgi:acetyl-CoA synthetase